MNSLKLNDIYNTDCLIGMAELPEKSIDMVLSDLPYVCLDCGWDKAINLPLFWEQINRVIKDNGAIVLTANIKFAVDLINSNKKYFRYDLIWQKTMPVGFANCNRMPMRSHELILVFYKKLPVYNPQGLIAIEKPKPIRKTFTDKEYAYPVAWASSSLSETQRGSDSERPAPPRNLGKAYMQKYTNYPRSVLTYSNGNAGTIHPTQKPLELFKYLILTYTNPDDVVLDTCMGSGTTAVAALETGRRFVGFEMDEGYWRKAKERLAALNS